MEVRPQEVAMGGWQRNWLGLPERSEHFIPIDSISDVTADADHVRLRFENAFGHYRSVDFQAQSAEQASVLAAALPAVRSPGYERWVAVRAFHARLRDADTRPWVTLATVVANVLVFVAMILVLKPAGLLETQQMIAWGANFGPLTLHGQWWRVLSALFLHGSFLHLFFNMWALWNVGRLTERLYGNWVYAFIYFAGGVLSELASIVWDPGRPTVGASGAIFGIFGAFVAFAIHPRSRVSVRVPPALWISLLVFALYNLILGFFQPGIDNAAHVGGLLSGLVLGWLMTRPLDVELRQRFPTRQLVTAAAVATIAVLGALWHAKGIGDQLTAPERYFCTHLWYVSGESENLRLWAQVGGEAAAGRISNAEIAERFKRQILPFWETTAQRLKREAAALPDDEHEIDSLLEDFVKLRAEWAQALID